jgi:hypothetical protein
LISLHILPTKVVGGVSSIYLTCKKTHNDARYERQMIKNKTKA